MNGADLAQGRLSLDEPDKRIADYELIEKIAQGGMVVSFTRPDNWLSIVLSR